MSRRGANRHCHCPFRGHSPEAFQQRGMSPGEHASDSRVAVVYSSLLREATRNDCCNLLTGGPVLGQRAKAAVKFGGWPCCPYSRTASKRWHPARTVLP